MQQGYGRGCGFGFRGASPPWPYVGVGRGGLPRCRWFAGGAVSSSPAVRPWRAYGFPYNREQEADWLKAEAESLREELASVEKRLGELHKGEG